LATRDNEVNVVTPHTNDNTSIMNRILCLLTPLKTIQPETSEHMTTRTVFNSLPCHYSCKTCKCRTQNMENITLLYVN